MGGVNTLQDLDKFLASPLQPKQQKAAFGPPPPAGVPKTVGPPKPPLPEVKSASDLDTFLKTPLEHYDMTPVRQYQEKQAQVKAWENEGKPPVEPPPQLGLGFLEYINRQWREGAEKIADKWFADPNVAGYSYRDELAHKARDPRLSPEDKKKLDQQVHDYDVLLMGGYEGGEQQKDTLTHAAPHTARIVGKSLMLDLADWYSPLMMLLHGFGKVGEATGAMTGTAGRIARPAFAVANTAVGGKFSYDQVQQGVEQIRNGQTAEGWANIGGGAAIGLMTMIGIAHAYPQIKEEELKEQSVNRLEALKRTLEKAPGFQRAQDFGYDFQLPPDLTVDQVQNAIDSINASRKARVAGDAARADGTIAGAPDKVPYNPARGGTELAETAGMYMDPTERAQQYYTLEEARKRLDEERRVASQEQEARNASEGELQRIARERREQFEGEKAYREAREGKRLVVSERRGLQFDTALAETNKQEHSRLTEEMNRIANEHMYFDAEDMLYSLDTEKGRGRELDEWKKNVFKLDSQRKELQRLSNPEALAPTRTEAFRATAEDITLAKRETAMREAAAKIEAEARKQTDSDEFERMTAEASEAKDRAEKIRTERDEKEAERIAATAEREEYPLGAMVDMVKGVGGQIILPDGRKVAFHYAVMPADQVISSHDPFNNFEPNPDAIQVSQGRDYKNNRESQAATIARGKNPEMALLVNTSPTAETGPPIVRSDGQALGGRNRVNIWKLLYKNGFADAAYDAMTDKAREFGVTVEQIANYYTTDRKPMIVRVLDDPYTSAKDLAQLGRDLDRTQTMGFSEAETAVMAGRSLSGKTMDWLTGQLDAMGDDASLRDLMRYRAGEVIERMLDGGMIEPTKRAEFVTSSGEMTERAKDLFEAAVLGKIIDDPELLQTTPKEVLRKLERSVAALARVKAAGGLWDFTPELKDSLRLWKRVDSVRESLNEIGAKDESLVDKYLNPGKYKMGTELMKFGEDTVRETPHPTVEALAKLLEKPGKEIKEAVGDYADDAEGKQITLGPAPSAVEAFNRHIGNLVKVDVPDDAWGVMRPKEAVSEPAPKAETPEPVPVKEEAPAPVVSAVPPALEGGVTVAGLENLLTQNKNIGEAAKPLLEAMGTVVKNALKMDLGDFLKKYWADIRTEGTPGENVMEQNAGDVTSWARRAGRKLTITPYGEQLGLFGGAEPQFLLRAKGGDERLVLKSELMRIRETVPRLQELVDSDGNVKQADMFGAEAENLFGPGEEEEEPPQGTLFQTENEKLAEVFAKSKSVGANEADWFTKAKDELFPGRRDLSVAEIGKVSAKAREMRIAAEGPKVLFQEKQGPWIYKSETVLKDAKLPVAQSGAQWAAMLKNKGVRADELKWMGIDDFLEGKKKVSKDELQHFIRENQLQVTEVAHNQPKFPARPTFDGAGDLVTNARGVRYEQYTLPGEKKNYTELLITTPVKAKVSGLSAEEATEFTKLDQMDPPEMTEEQLHRRWELYVKGNGETPMFTSSHFEEPNVLAHVRFDERTDAAGNRILLVEEVQSDWHQKGKKSGYGSGKRAELEAKMKPLEAERQPLWEKLKPLLEKDQLGGHSNLANAAEDAAKGGGNEYSPETVEAARAWYAKYKPWQELYEKYLDTPEGVPDAPFKTDWHELVMKRMLREAAERGYDKIAWVTGEQTADRYDLSKQINRIVTGESMDGKQVHLYAEAPGGKVVMDQPVDKDKLADYVGKDLAEKILRGEGKRGMNEELIYEGLDLKVGGTWAKALYDNAIPNFMRKYGKKWDARVGTLDINVSPTSRDISVEPLDFGSFGIFDRDDYNAPPIAEFPTREAADAYVQSLKESQAVHSMDISPEMKKSVMEGQPLFQVKKGATEFLNDGRAVVYMFENADASTFLHEFFHTMRRYLSPEDTKVLEDWMKIKDGAWSRKDEEDAARAWEYYHRETKPKSLPEKVAAVFKKIQTLMRSIYEQLKGSPLVKPSKEVSALFDRWYGKEMEAPPAGKELVAPPARPNRHEAETMDEVILGALHVYEGSDKQWEKLRTAGVSDKDLRTIITEYLGTGGFTTKRGLADTRGLEVSHKVGDQKEIVKGAALVKRVRELLDLPQPREGLEPPPGGSPPDVAVTGEIEDSIKEGKSNATLVAWAPEKERDSKAAMDYASEQLKNAGWEYNAGEKQFEKGGWYAFLRSQGELSPPILQWDRIEKAAAKEKIAPAAELEAPPLSKEERKDASLKAQGGILPLDTGTIRTKVFDDFTKATEWAKSNKDKIKGLQIFALQDGRAVADFTAKKENVLFQTEHEREREKAAKIAALSARLQHMMSDAERAAVNRQIRDLKAAPVAPLAPPPGQIVSLWTPEGERPVEVTRAEKETRPSRTVPDEAIRLSEPPRPREAAERPGTSRVSEPKPATGRGVRTAGEGKGERAGVGEPRTSLRDVRPLSVERVRPRGEAAYSGKDWESRVEKFKLPENAPAPTRTISDELGRMLMPGQREVVESIVSGLDQHDGYILATTTGTGKTYMGSAVIADALASKPDSRVLILTPSQSLVHGRDGWIQVAGNFGVEVEPLPVGEVPEQPGVFIKTWAGGIANREIEDVPWDLVIMDEVQEARKWWTSQRGDMSKTMGENAKKILYTSATPFHTALEIGHMGKLGLWGQEGFEQWAAQNGLGVYRDKAGNLAGGKAPLRLEKLRQQLIERGQMINIDRNMDGYSAHFGKVPMDGVTAQGLANIDQALRLAENYFERSGKKGMIQAVKAQRTTLAKRWLEFQRLPQAVELAKKLEKEGWKVIFFSENKKEFNELFDFLKPADEAMGGRISQIMPKFDNTTDVLRKHFGEDIAIFAGKHSSAREAEKDAFNDDDKSHLYATYGAGGVGVSMHDKGGENPRAVIYLGPPWSGIAFDQALGRPWRYGTKSNVRAYFLFSDSQAEMDLVTNKVAPRMESLRAMVSGVNFDDPVVKNLRAIPDNQVGALDYDHGNAHEADFEQFTKRADNSGVSSYSELPIVSANEAKNKGMRLPGSDGAQDPSVIRLWQDSVDDDVIPQDFEAPELTLGRAVNVDLAERFIQTGAAPGNSAGRILKPAERRQLADAIMARAEAAASADPASATQQVYTEWENGMKQIDAILSGGDDGALAPPPGEGIPGVPGSEEPPKPEKIGGWKAFEWYALTNGRDVIRGAAKKAGVPQIGEKIARAIAQYHVESGNIAGPWTTRYWDILKDNKITPEEHKVLALTNANREKPSPAIDRQLQELRAKAPMNPRIEKAVNETQALFKEVFNRMQKDNIYLTVWDAVSGKPRQVYYNEFASGKGYWPRKYDFDSDIRVRDPKTGIETVFNLRNLTKGDMGASKREAIINGMMDRYGISRAEVEDFLQSKKRDVPLMGHIERAREVDMPFFRTDPEVVISYLEGAGELLSRKRFFEQDGSKMKGLIAQIPDQKARNITAGIVESLLKRNPMEDESRALLRFAADWSTMKMAFSAIKVLGHPVHGALLTNMRAFGKALFEGVADYKQAARMAQLAGSTQEQTKIEMLSEYGINKKGIASTMLKWNGWQGAYKWGRVVADANGRIYMTDYAMSKLLKDPTNEVVRRQLKEFMQLDDSKIDAAIARRRWSESDLAWGAKAFADKVMFTFDPTELPPWWRARAGGEKPAEDALLAGVRVVTLLKGYQFKTHALLKDAIWDEAMKGNFRPLIPFLALYPAAGFLIHSLTALATANVKYFKTLMQDKSWTPGRTAWRIVDEVAHMIGDTALTAWLDAAVHGKETLSGTIGEEYFTGAVVSDAARTINLPIELEHAKTARTKEKAVKRYVEGTFPFARTMINLFEPPPGGESSESKPLPHIP